MTTPHIDIDECVQRYIAAFDEIAYLAEKLAPHMGIATHNELAKDFFKKIDFEIMEHPVAQLLNAARELSQLRKGEHPDFVMVPRDIINSIKIQSDFFSQDGININLAVMTLKQISLACESITAQKLETK
jgi:hypothetical protein